MTRRPAAFTAFASSALSLLACAAIASLSGAAPALASGTQVYQGPKVCFVNSSGARFHFKVLYGDGSKGGTKLGNAGKFCVSYETKPTVVQIRQERRSALLCSAKLRPGQTYRLIAQPAGGKCQWKSSAN